MSTLGNQLQKGDPKKARYLAEGVPALEGGELGREKKKKKRASLMDKKETEGGAGGRKKDRRGGGDSDASGFCGNLEAERKTLQQKGGDST